MTAIAATTARSVSCAASPSTGSRCIAVIGSSHSWMRRCSFGASTLTPGIIRRSTNPGRAALNAAGSEPGFNFTKVSVALESKPALMRLWVSESGDRLEPNTSPDTLLLVGQSSTTAATLIGVPSTCNTPPIGASRPKYLRAAERVRTRWSGASSACAGSPATAVTATTLKKSGSAHAKPRSAMLMSPRRRVCGKPELLRNRAAYWICGKSSFRRSLIAAGVVSWVVGLANVPVIRCRTRNTCWCPGIQLS